MQRNSPNAEIIGTAGLIILLLGILLFRAYGASSDTAVGSRAESSAQDKRQQRCASQRTYDRVKDELFRRAVETRGSDRAPFDRISSYASVRVERPLLTDHDKELGTVRCSGRLSLDLPPGVAVVGGRRTLTADIDYVLQPAADGSGDVVMLEGADSIIIPLATLATAGSRPASQAPESAPAVAQTGPDERAYSAPPPVPAPSPSVLREGRQATPAEPPEARNGQASGKPSFNCRYARTRGEIAVCGDSRLAALDRQMAAQYFRAISASDARQRRLLTRSRDAFLRYRDQCPSNDCIAQAYRGRMREISDIAENR